MILLIREVYPQSFGNIIIFRGSCSGLDIGNQKYNEVQKNKKFNS